MSTSNDEIKKKEDHYRTYVLGKDGVLSDWVDYANMTEIARDLRPRYFKKKWVPEWIWNLFADWDFENVSGDMVKTSYRFSQDIAKTVTQDPV